jgi:hypothetical protein
MSEGKFLPIYNEKWEVFLAVRDFNPNKAEYPVYYEKLGTPGLRADWRFDKVQGGYKIALDHADDEKEFRLALDIKSVKDLKNMTQLHVIREDVQIGVEGSDLWALIGAEVTPDKGSANKYYYIISCAKDAPTIYAIDAGSGEIIRTKVWQCIADSEKESFSNQHWETNPISINELKK